MKEYVITIIIVGVIGSVISILAPDGEGGRLVRLAASLVALVVCISPVIDAVEWLRTVELGAVIDESGDREEYERIFYEHYSKAEIENCREGIKALLCEKFGLDEDDIEVFAEAEEGKLERVYITLYGAAIWQDTAVMEDYLKSLLSCEIITVIG
jgi:hypothetical protein